MLKTNLRQLTERNETTDLRSLSRVTFNGSPLTLSPAHSNGRTMYHRMSSRLLSAYNELISLGYL